MDSTTGYISTLFGITFTSERLKIAHGKKVPTAFNVSPERHWQSWIKEIAKVSKRHEWDSNSRAL